MSQIPYKFFIFLTSLTLLTGCYRMPTEDDYCLIPSTNNPNFTNDNPKNNMMPGVGY